MTHLFLLSVALTCTLANKNNKMILIKHNYMTYLLDYWINDVVYITLSI